MKEFLEIMIPAFIAGVITFVFVENIAFERDKSGITGYVLGLAFALVVASIVGMFIMIIIARTV